VKREGEGDELVGRASPRPPHGLVQVPSSRNDDMSLESLEPSKPSKL
jgi:hypothetical protein